jgi:hypothetical protein
MTPLLRPYAAQTLNNFHFRVLRMTLLQRKHITKYRITAQAQAQRDWECAEG